MLDAAFIKILVCPKCRGTLHSASDTELCCEKCAIFYPIANGRAVLLRQDNKVFPISLYLAAPAQRAARTSLISRYIPGRSINLARKGTLVKLRELLDVRGKSKVLVVGGGNQRAWLSPLLRQNCNHAIVYSDIDVHADVDVFCDGHDLPFADASFDAVITTAVLEHVIDPERVASEIGRVVKIKGYVYSELPFMQQVHEGAYDFTRYTLSGHRRLFHFFEELDAGLVAGTGTALVWALEAFAVSFSRRRIARNLATAATRLCFFWLKYFDHITKHNPAAMDGASCTYFLGSRIEAAIQDDSIIARYVGAIGLSHG